MGFPSLRPLRSFATIPAIALFLLFARPASADEIVPSDRVQTGVLVREEPMGDPAAVLGALRPGERAELLETVPYYYRVRLANGVTGYVSKSWTEQVAVAPVVGELQLHFIDVGQGDSTLVICPNGSTILIDAGSTSGRSPDEVKQTLMTYIEPLGADIDYLIVSHPDEDHYNLLAELLDQISIGRAYFVGARTDYYQQAVYDWLTTAPAVSTRLPSSYYNEEASPNPEIDCGAARVWILAAAVEHPDSRKNAMSIVVMVRMGEFEAVITGDATHATENVIMDRYRAEWLDVDVLRIGHHGSFATSTSVRWADTLSPRTAIVSAGYSNTYGHPRAEVIERVTPHTKTDVAHGFRDARRNETDQGPRYIFTDRTGYTESVYTTAVSGTVSITTDGRSYRVATNR